MNEVFVYDEFGQILHGMSGMESQPFAYTGYQSDSVSETFFAQARQYNSKVGRFISQDVYKGTIDRPFTQNQYIYCWNQPLDLVDLDGRIPDFLEVIVDWFIDIGEAIAYSTTVEIEYGAGFGFRHQDGENTPMFGLLIPDGSLGWDRDVEVSFGKRAYFGLGGGFNINFNFSELRRRLQGIGSQENCELN